MRLVGLTGGIACGKSLVATECSQRGLPVIDCDIIARQCTVKGSWGWRRVGDAFKHHDIFDSDGSINRQKLGDLVFSDSSLRNRLNKATHLPIQVIDMPLLFESKSEWLFRDIIVVTCEHEQQLQRLCRRNEMSEEAALARMRAQMPQAYKAAHASILIDNSGSISNTQQQVESALDNLSRKNSVLEAMLLPFCVGAALALVTYWMLC